ncbi:hypothetical protein LTR08_006957 [Meristemomyces frigidus]|nr:hypothetical protein LTR08_006957 [Meristemomyces frigidus]
MAEKDFKDGPVHHDAFGPGNEDEKYMADEAQNDTDINNNSSARIRNPLAGISHQTLMRDVEEFGEEFQLSDIVPLLKKGALVAQNPGEFENVEGLQEDELEALRNEIVHKWRQPRAMYFTVILCSVGAAVQGWDQTGSNGANLSFPTEFGIADSKGDPNYESHLWLVGLINAAPYIASAFCGCWLSDPLNN